MGKPFHVQVVLVGDYTLTAIVTEQEAEALYEKNVSGRIGPDQDRRKELGRVVYSILIVRLNKGSGFLTLWDVEGRHWIVPAKNVLAASFEDPEEVRDEPRFGFDLDRDTE